MMTLHLKQSIDRSPLRLGLLLIPLALFLALAGVAGDAHALRPPVCPGPDCQKVIEFWNNSDHPVFPVIQAGIQNPDPWLQALFNDNSHTYAETHYSRVHINPVHGIPPGGHVSVTIPWYSKLLNDNDTYADWYNGGRIVLFDSAEAVRAAGACRARPPNPCNGEAPLRFTPDSPPISCNDCSEPLTFYKDTFAYDPKYPFQLNEYTFATVETPPGRTPFISTLNVGYNVSYLDQIYLPVALAPCRTEPCNGAPDPTAIGYLGTIQALTDFRTTLTNFSDNEGWPRYKGQYENAIRPRLPGAYNVLVDQVNVIEKHQPSQFTPAGVSVTDLIAQWNTCTTGEDRVNCPQYDLYKQIDGYFRRNYDNYIAARSANCPPSPDYPVPAPPVKPLDIMAKVYGWVPFNSGCAPRGSFNDLKTSPGPEATFTTTQADYIGLQYNYTGNGRPKKERFNPFVDLVHGQLKANSYAFSVDDAAGYQQQPGQGLIIAIGGARGLPNPQPVVPPPNFKKGDFVVNLGDSMPLHRPRWKSFGVCKNVADTDFPPLPPNATQDTPQFIVHTLGYNISQTNPCTITVTDASDRVYQFRVLKPVPWPAYTPARPPDRSVVSCIGRSTNWCGQMTEGAILDPLNFYLNTIAPDPTP